MKKNILIVAALIIATGTIEAKGKVFQAGDTVKTERKVFETGDIIIDAGLGAAGYVTRTYTTVGSAATVLNGKNWATSTMYPVNFEYGFRDWFGSGARFAYSNYYDSIKSDKSVDIDFVLNFHFIKTKRFEMPISLFFGFSTINIKYNDVNTSAKANGANNGFMLTPRFYLTEHFGLFVNLGFVNYVYTSLSFSNNTLYPATTTVSVSRQGETCGFGAVYKF